MSNTIISKFFVLPCLVMLCAVGCASLEKAVTPTHFWVGEWQLDYEKTAAYDPDSAGKLPPAERRNTVKFYITEDTVIPEIDGKAEIPQKYAILHETKDRIELKYSNTINPNDIIIIERLGTDEIKTSSPSPRIQSLTAILTRVQEKQEK